MNRRACLAIISTVLAVTSVASGENMIVFTANQNWLSRVYILRMDGSVHDYFEYSFYRFVDMEVVDNELYAADAFAPRVYKVDPVTGGLDVIIDDWSLYYFYGLAYDDEFFYVAEWDLNRYDINGVKNGTASFDGDVFGSAWDGAHFWTLDDTNVIQCWDLSGWPTVRAVPPLNFTPPSPECRGLWFDGEYFWSAESKDGILGKIYRFDHEGHVIREWTEPAFSGWGACVLDVPVTDVGVVAHGEDAPACAGLWIQNPVHATTSVRFSVPRASRATLQVYNALGQNVAILLSEDLPPGYHEKQWTPSGLASGIYFFKLEAAGERVTKKLLLLE